MPIRPGRRSTGITLVEMMVVVMILGVLAAIAAPSLSEPIIRNRLDTTANDFMTALNLARSEAIRRGEIVVVRRVIGSAAQEWTKGWEVFVDSSGNDRIRDAGEELIRSGQPLSSPMTLYGSISTAETFLAFAPSGRVVIGASNMTFVLCYSGQIALNAKSRSRAVIVNDAGRVRVAATNASGQPVKDTALGTAAVTSCTNP